MTVTAEDMTKFMTMLLNKGELDGQRILTPESWKEFVDFSSNKLDPRLPTWGRIIYETFNGGRYAYGHDGGVGRFRTILRIYPQSGIGLLFAGGAVLTLIGLIAELQFVLDVLYHGGHTAIAVAWRLVLHCGVLALAIAPLYVLFARRELLSLPTGGTRVGKSAYVVLLCVSSWLVVLLAGYWGFLGRFTN